MTGSKTGGRILLLVAAVVAAASSASAQPCPVGRYGLPLPETVFLGTYNHFYPQLSDSLLFWESCMGLNPPLVAKGTVGVREMPQFAQSVVARVAPTGAVYVYAISAGGGFWIWQYTPPSQVAYDPSSTGTFAFQSVLGLSAGGSWLAVSADASRAYIGNLQTTAGAGWFG